MLSGIGPANHLAEVGVDAQGRPAGRRREPAGPPGGAAALVHPRHHRPRPAQQPAQLRPLEGARHRPAGLQRRRGRRRSSPAATGCPRPTSRSTWRRPASTTTGCTSRPRDVHRRADAGLGRAAAAPSGCARPTRPGTRRSRRRTSRTRPTSTRCSPALRRTFEICTQGALAALPRPAVEPARPTRPTRTSSSTSARGRQTLYHPTSTCAMGSGEDAVVDPQLRVRGVDGPAGRRRLGHARRAPRQHQRPHHHGRREGRRPDQELAMTQTADRTATATTFESLNPAHRRRRRHPPGPHGRGGPGRGRPRPRGGRLVVGACPSTSARSTC